MEPHQPGLFVVFNMSYITVFFLSLETKCLGKNQRMGEDCKWGIEAGFSFALIRGKFCISYMVGFLFECFYSLTKVLKMFSLWGHEYSKKEGIKWSSWGIRKDTY